MVLMDKYDAFRKHIADSAKKFQELKNETVRIISHLDCDGICAASILIHALKSQNRGFAISIVPQLTETFIKELAKEEYKIIAFTDLGSGMIEQVKEHLKSKDVVILDHHEVSASATTGFSTSTRTCLALRDQGKSAEPELLICLLRLWTGRTRHVLTLPLLERLATLRRIAVLKGSTPASLRPQETRVR